MKNITVSLSLPQALLFDCGFSQQSIQEFMMQTFVMALYRQDRISSGKSAHLLGIHRMAFIRLLADEGIPYIDYSIDEFESELASIKQWNHAS